jgi:hypothetical protein
MELHLATCAACSELYAEAQRGQAWLDVLKASRPEPPASLAMRILSQTSGVGVPVLTPALAGVHLVPARRGAVVSIYAAMRNVLYQPRLAMTAAMAFFSLSLTVNMTGVKLNELHWADLRPGHLERQFYQADAQLIRYYDNLPVVNAVETNVQHLITTPANQNDLNAPDQNSPKQNDPDGSSRREIATPAHVAAVNELRGSELRGNEFSTKNLEMDLFERNLA